MKAPLNILKIPEGIARILFFVACIPTALVAILFIAYVITDPGDIDEIKTALKVLIGVLVASFISYFLLMVIARAILWIIDGFTKKSG